MKWLQDNPVGMVLAAICGVFALLALGMAIIWNLPVTAEAAEIGTEENGSSDTILAAHQISAISDFQVINEKPVFNESRLPVLLQSEDDDLLEVDAEVGVKDAPDVKLTGVIITPSMKIASLKPADGKLENVMAHEGESLTGEFIGWQVSVVHPRSVVLASRDGQKLKLDLQVHDIKIKAPPKPAVPAKTAQTKAGQDNQAAGEDEQPLSRAEQIRQRIAERREELRLEQEEQQAQGGTQPGQVSQAAKPQDYQSAIRALMKNNSKDKSSNDKKDG